MKTESVRIDVDVLKRYRKLSKDTGMPIARLIEVAMAYSENSVLFEGLKSFKKGENHER